VTSLNEKGEEKEKHCAIAEILDLGGVCSMYKIIHKMIVNDTSEMLAKTFELASEQTVSS
jgi:hypothetical protein